MITTSEILVSKTHIEPLQDDGYVIYPVAYIGPVVGGKREAYSKGGNIKTHTPVTIDPASAALASIDPNTQVLTVAVQSSGVSHVPVTKTDSSTVAITLTDQHITASVIQSGLSLANFWEKNFTSLVNKPTTISGYGITDAYTKLESDTRFEPAFTKNTAFNKNFGTVAGTVLEGRTFGTAAAAATTDFAPASGSGNYIQNQNSIDQVANARISGNFSTPKLTLTQVSPPSAYLDTSLGGVGLLNGNYTYVVTYYTSIGETDIIGGSSPYILATNNQINLTNIPISSDNRVIGRRIYRNKSTDDDVAKRLVVDIPNNTNSTYTDNIPDSSLGVYANRGNTTGGVIYVNNNPAIRANSASILIGLENTIANTGYANTLIGSLIAPNATSMFRTTAVGLSSLYSNIIGSNITALGVHAGQSTNVDGGVFLGYGSGFYETGSNKLFIDNQPRSSESNGRISSLIYGEFNANPLNQLFRVNGQVETLNLTANGYVKATQFFCEVPSGEYSRITLTSGNHVPYINTADGNLNFDFVNTATYDGNDDVLSGIRFFTNNDITSHKLHIKRSGIINIPSLASASTKLVTATADGTLGVIDMVYGGGISDHGALSGLGDDDHTQYYNQTRADARFAQKAGLNSQSFSTLDLTATGAISSVAYLLNGNNLFSSLSTNYLPYWDGGKLINSSIDINPTSDEIYIRKKTSSDYRKLLLQNENYYAGIQSHNGDLDLIYNYNVIGASLSSLGLKIPSLASASTKLVTATADGTLGVIDMVYGGIPPATLTASTTNQSSATHTHAITGFLPLTGGTLTGALYGTTASFSSTVQGSQFYLNNGSAFGGIWNTGSTVEIGALSGSSTLNFKVNGSTQMTLTNSGLSVLQPVTATSFVFGTTGFSFEVVSGKVVIKYNGTALFSFDSSGNIKAAGEIYRGGL